MQLQLSKFQERVLAIPEALDVFLGGGRGGAKSYTLVLLALRHVAQYGSRARILYLRQTYKGLADFELLTRELFATVYRADARYNGADHVWRLPGGGYLELGQLEGPGDYAKYQGHGFSLLLIDEAGQWATPDLLDLMRSNLRAPRDIPIRVVMAGNPGGVGHHWIARRYVFRAQPWEAFYEEKSKRSWVYAPSTFLDNEFIDQQQYRAQLESACPTDPELLRAWLDGDWTVSRGAYFAGCLEESRNAVGPFTYVPADRENWITWLAHDFGSSAPSVTLLMCRSPGGTFAGSYYPRDSIIVIDELAAYRRDNLNLGLGWTAATTAEAIRSELCDKWKVTPDGVADDACFSKMGAAAGSISDEFAAAGVRFQPARKRDRISGWQKMKRMLADAGKPDVPGLFISRSCEYFWATTPFLARDQRRVEDLDSSGPDHAADACRYGLNYDRPVTQINLRMAM
jgi:Phage terminase large subunit